MINLLYYDLKNTARKIFGYIFGIVIFTCIVRFLWSNSFMFFFNNDNFYIADVIRWVSIGVLLCLIALIIIYVMVRQTQWFDENILSSQGQLTNMLPVSGRKIILSKIITAFIWSVVLLIVIFLIGVIFYIKTDRLSDLFGIISDVEEYGTSDRTLIMLLINFSIFAVVTMCAVISQCFLSLIIGQLFSRFRNFMIFLSFVIISVLVLSLEISVLNLFDGGILASIKTQADTIAFCRIAFVRLIIMNFMMTVVYWLMSSKLLTSSLNLL